MKTAQTEIDQLERPFSDREQYLERRLHQIEEQFKAFQEQLKTSDSEKTKAKGLLNKSLIS